MSTNTIDWKTKMARDYKGRYAEIGRDTARVFGIPWSTCWDFKQVLLNGEFNLTDNVTMPKILFFDIETAPILGHLWSIWQNGIGINQVMQDWYMLSWSAKFLGEDTVYNDALPKHEAAYLSDPEDDFLILQTVWAMLDKADVVIGHNAKKFDIKKIKARFLKHGMDMPSSYKVIDTLSIAKAEFGLTSNKLDFLATFLGLDNKVSHEGHDLWTKCMHGQKDAWDRMIEYNNRDVTLLEEVYLHLRKYDQRHPNLAVYCNDSRQRCTTCCSDDLQPTEGFVYTNTGKYEELACGGCGKVSRGTVNLLDKEKRCSRTVNIIS